MKIICLDSSGLTASVAVSEDEQLIAEYNVTYKKTHSQTLLPMLDEICRMTELDLESVDAIAIAKGPGSFTGLRIGSATAKGLSQALNKPIVEVSTLEGMACNLYGSREIICPIMDARRQQVYAGMFEYEEISGAFESDSTCSSSYILKRVMEDIPLGIEELMAKAEDITSKKEKKIVFLGDGVPVFKDTLLEGLKDRCIFAPAHMNRQRAAAFAYLAMDKLQRGESVTCYEHAPEYLRLSQAERERNEGIRNKGSNY